MICHYFALLNDKTIQEHDNIYVCAIFAFTKKFDSSKILC